VLGRLTELEARVLQTRTKLWHNTLSKTRVQIVRVTKVGDFFMFTFERTSQDM